MPQPNLSATAPAGLRIVQMTSGARLVVALPLPSGSGAPQQLTPSSSLAVAAALPTHDRAFWQKFNSSPASLKISTVLRGLGLRQRNSGPGKILFQYSSVKQLADAVTDAAKALPATTTALIDAAADYNYAPLQEEIAQLLHRFGEEIWGTVSERPWLFKASEGNAEYQKDLVFEDAADKVVLMYYLRLWILAKAFNRTRNKNVYMPSAMKPFEPDATTRLINPRAQAIDDQKPRKVRKVWFVDDHRDEISDDDVTKRTDHGHQRTEGLDEETLTERTPASTLMKGNAKSKGKRRPKKKYLSAAVIRNSSDESEEEAVRPIITSLQGRGLRGVETHQAVPSAKGRSEASGLDSDLASEPDDPSPVSKVVQLRRKKPMRQGIGACRSCSQRHKRCDRVHPICGRCTRLDLTCEFSDITKPPSTTSPALLLRSTSSESGFEVRRATNNNKSLATSKMPLTEYWSKDEWHAFYLEGDEREAVLATMQSLGLRAILQHPVLFRFSIKHFVSLGTDINTIALRLSSRFSAAQLIQYAEDQTYLDDDIDALFETHSSIWSLDADRTMLIAPDVDNNYPKDLFYEESEDQKLLWIHLHRWIFLMTLVICKQMHGPEESNTKTLPQFGDDEPGEDMLDNPQLDYVHMFETPEGTSTTDPHSLLQTSASGATDSSPNSDPTSKNPPKRNPKRKDSGTTTPGPRALRPPKQPRTTQHLPAQKAHELCALFLSYLQTYTDSSFNELAALKHLSRELSLLELHTPTFHSAHASDLASAFLSTAFPAWLTYRTEVVTVKRQLAAVQSPTDAPQQHHHLVVLERSRLATQLRLARETFMAAGYGVLRAEQVIAQAVEVGMGGSEQAEVRRGLRKGFVGMEEEVGELGDRLMRAGGAKWVMGEFPAVGSLEGLRTED